MNFIVFPGQGSQQVGMGREVYDNFATAREVAEIVNEVFQDDITKVMWNDADKLKLTNYSQPAIFLTSMMLLTVLIKDFDFDLVQNAKYLAGHSVGEYTALMASGVFDSVYDGARVLKLRSQLMHQYANHIQGGMLAVIGLDDHKKLQSMIDEFIHHDNNVCTIANDNTKNQVVLSGTLAVIDQLQAKVKEYGAKMGIKLEVEGAFHSPLMSHAAHQFQHELRNIEINLHQPNIPVVANLTAKPIDSINDFPEFFANHIISMVRWRDIMDYVIQHQITQMIEIGNGEVLSGLMKRFDSSIKRVNLQTPQDIELFVNSQI